jgi:hypothetical protein
MTTIPTWLAVLVPVLAAAVTAGLGLVRVAAKSRSDARGAAKAASREQAEWVRERRERVYVELLNAIRNYAGCAPAKPGFEEAGLTVSEETFLLVHWPALPEREESAWRELTNAIAGIQPYGSTPVREASARLLNLEAKVRDRLISDADDTDFDKLRRSGQEIRVQRRLVADLIRKELGVDD